MAIIKMTSTIHCNGFYQEAYRFILPRLKMFLAVAFCCLVCLAAHAAGFTASLDRDTITLGENATMSLTFDGGRPESLNMPNVPGLQIEKMGYSFNNSIDTSGQGSSTMTVTFSVTPQQTGNFVIPAMTTAINGQQVSSQPLKLTVQKAEAPTAAQINSGSQIAFMRMYLPQKKVCPGEALAAQLQVFFRDDVQNYGDFQFNGIPTDGFSVGKIVKGNPQRVSVGNRNYTLLPISVLLTATKTGSLTIGPIPLGVTVLTGAQQEGFMVFGGQQQRVALTADTVTVESIPVPTENVPASFNGALGEYTMNVTAGPTNVAVGDPITVRVQISGPTPDSISLPNQSGWNDFKIFSPTSKTQLNDDLGNRGTRTFEEIVTPQDANVRELPPLSFSFFDPEKGSYQTLTQPATPLSVTAAAATPLPTVAAAKQSENQLPPQDIVPIRENLGTVVQPGAPLVMRPAFLALQSVPVIAFLAALIWRKREDNLANNPRLRRQRAVAQLIAGGLDDLNKFAAENKSDEFFAMLFRLLQEQLGERLDCPAISITEADVDSLASRGAGQDTLNSLRELFQACNQARYAPIQTSQELSALASKFKKSVAELQELKA